MHYKPLLDQTIEMAKHNPQRCVILRRPQEPGTMIAGRDVHWDEAMAATQPQANVTVATTGPLYIFTPPAPPASPRA
jgi:propionyl-CoA synthetase